jgi:D-alanyl-D-alanine carboxypeptidase (penicillin-binding protein 5/6)
MVAERLTAARAGLCRGGCPRARRLLAPTALALAAALSFAPGQARAGLVRGGRGPAGLVPARALLLYERDTGRVVYAFNGSDELPIASTTKIMTALVTVERLPADEVLTEQPYVAGPGESLAGVPAGTRLSVADMLRAMLLPSGNDVANSLAIDVAGSVPRFVELMNRWARRLNLGRTYYTTPIGLDQPAGNYSTALDLARLAAYALRNRLFAAIVHEPRARLADGIVVANRNDLVGEYPWVVGVKTGSTAAAGYCMVGAARLNGVHLISVVLGAPSAAARDADTLALLRRGLNLYRRADLAHAGRTYATLPVAGRTRTVELVASRSLSLVVARATTLHAALNVPARLVGPLPAGAVEGSITVRENGRPVASVALVTATAVPAPRPPPPPAHRQLSPLVWAAAGGGVGALLLGCSLPLMRRRSARGDLEAS